ncbi:MAG: MBL fold metallo-hydrolase [Lachnospiraceae bacterium]|nr:MBL fold metallo-hydrolase [Lachnospiraceae bacterium]
MRLVSIASGSSGNCIYVGTEQTHLLVDVGISNKKTEAGLNEIGLSCRDLDGILITHEHSDHIQGLGVISRKFGVPIYATKGTIDGILRCKSLGVFDTDLFHEITPGEAFDLKDINVSNIPVSHDANEPVAYQFQSSGKKIAVATDMGTYTDDVVEALSGMDAILLEANHDVNMLQVGPYPYILKQRILGNRGHLSNEASGRLLSRILHDNMNTIILGHLSKENNLPELAYETVKLEVTMADNPYDGNDFPILVAKRDGVSACVTI